MENQHSPNVRTPAATVFAFLTFFFLPHFGYGEIENPQSHRADPVVPGQFIVVLNRGFDPAQVAADHAAIPLHVYRVASRGFAARLSNAQANALRSDPRVNNVVADRKVTTAAKPGTGGGGGTIEDRGRKRLSPSPPSEPCVRFSRTRLSSRWFPHRDWLASFQAVCMVNSPWAAKNLLGQRL